jgi:antitoxin ChpS
MTTVQIDIPDDRAADLSAKANAYGMSLKSWIESMLTNPETPRRRRRYTAAELVAQCDSASTALSDEDRAWLDAPPVGREVL